MHKSHLCVAFPNFSLVFLTGVHLLLAFWPSDDVLVTAPLRQTVEHVHTNMF